jgi:hypothetical protein
MRVRVGPSRIAGQGLFAGQEIKQGTKIIRYIGQKITHEESELRLAAGNTYIFGGSYWIPGSSLANFRATACFYRLSTRVVTDVASLEKAV